MKLLNRFWIFCALTLATQTTHATLLDFASDAHASEQGYALLTYTGWWGDLKITGHASNDDDSTQFAYMDSHYGGLGACKDLTASDQCTPSNDDNVTHFEWLTFIFDQDVYIKNLWVNNNHDGGFASGASLYVDGSAVLARESGNTLGAYQIANSIGDFRVSAHTAFTLAYHNTQFYVTAMEVVGLPEGGSVVLLIIGIFGLALVRYRE